MSNYNTASEIPEPQLNTYQEIIEGILEFSPIEDYDRIVEDRYNSLEEKVKKSDSIYIDDNVAETQMYHDNPLEYFEWREAPERIASDVIHVEDDGMHPVFDFEDVENNFDEHFVYLSVHPENRVTGKNMSVPEVNINGFSVDHEEDMVYFGSMESSGASLQQR